MCTDTSRYPQYLVDYTYSKGLYKEVCPVTLVYDLFTNLKLSQSMKT